MSSSQGGPEAVWLTSMKAQDPQHQTPAGYNMCESPKPEVSGCLQFTLKSTEKKREGGRDA